MFTYTALLAGHRDTMIATSCYQPRATLAALEATSSPTPRRTSSSPLLNQMLARHSADTAVARPLTPPQMIYKPKELKEPSLKQTALHFMGGTFGGMLGIAASYPLDTVKVRMQTSRGASGGMTSVIYSIAKNEGMRTFYKGVQAPLAAYGLIKATTFGVYGNCLDYFAARAGDPNHKPTLLEIVIAGHLSGFAAAFIMAPSDSVKIAMQSAQKGGEGVFHETTWGCAKHIVKTEGFRGLFRGFTATALRDGPGMALYYIVYDGMKKLIPGMREDGSHNALQMLCFGGLSGIVSWLPVYPLDVIKSRIQAPGGAQRYKGMLDCAVKSSIAEGPWVLYKGCLPVLMGAVPLHGTVFMVYELWMQFTEDW